MESFNFWQKWLLIFGIYLSAFGIVLTFFSNTEVMNFIFNNHIDPLFWGNDTLQQDIINFRSWIYGVLGATISGWGVSIAFIAHYPFREKQKWAWNCIFIGAMVWFLLDTIITIKYKVGFNLFFNSLLLIFMLVPLVFTYNHFHSKKKID